MGTRRTLLFNPEEMDKSKTGKIIDKTAIIDILLNGEIDLRGQFTLGSNYTFLVGLNHPSGSVQAVYKPQQGEIPLWDFPPESLAGRENAAYILSEALGWELVPPTAMRSSDPLGRGSLQLYIPHDPEINYFSFDDATIQRLKPTALFDLVINNADRKGSHIILDEDQHIWLIDHGLCFHPSPKLRSVIWDFADQSVPAELVHDLVGVLEQLHPGEELSGELSQFIGPEEISALKSRILNIINHPIYPKPDTHKRQFPWPLV
jgi:uncharacterized repeat protein (TIGR03843 family)